MTATRKIMMLALAGALTVGGVPVLTACSPQQALQGAVENAIEDATGVDVNVDGGTMPEGFPAEVPVISGEITSSGSLGTGADRAWSVVVKVSDPTTSYEDAKGKLLAAGFNADFDATADGASTGMFSNAQYSVVVATTGTGSDNNVSYVVTQVVTP
ncbi:MAG: hypothetical protein F2808_07260 [Actinobacteria bacterium]|uniref:Unannotated protein n=1 Tax=freshwater metagenome TaxID=449393 RepID=A0A6J7H072_9ZZZZ|nr:hypothetical protein [Actinomycetota bacterium]